MMTTCWIGVTNAAIVAVVDPLALRENMPAGTMSAVINASVIARRMPDPSVNYCAALRRLSLRTVVERVNSRRVVAEDNPRPRTHRGRFPKGSDHLLSRRFVDALCVTDSASAATTPRLDFLNGP